MIYNVCLRDIRLDGRAYEDCNALNGLFGSYFLFERDKMYTHTYTHTYIHTRYPEREVLF